MFWNWLFVLPRRKAAHCISKWPSFFCAHCNLISRCDTITRSRNSELCSSAQAIHSKLLQYKALICSEPSPLAKPLDPQFASDTLDVGDILRANILLRISVEGATTDADSGSSSLLTQAAEDATGLVSLNADDNITYLQTTTVDGISFDLLQWWLSNVTRYCYVANLLRNGLNVLSSSVAIKSCF